MVIKDILYQIKEDLKRIKKYPDFDAGENLNVDYDKYWKKRRGENQSLNLSLWQKERADYILKMIEKKSSVMDIGCGDGALLKYLKDNLGVGGFGVDISDDVLKIAEQNGIKVFKRDITDLKSLSDLPEVDYILGLEIIEHMPNPEQFIYTLKNKTRRGFIFSFPNTGYYEHRLRLLFGRFPLQWVTHPGEHLRFWTVRDVKWWIKAINFNLEKIVIYQGVPVLNKICPKLFGRGILIKIK